MVGTESREEFIQLRGIVRPQDISPANTIASTMIADARISYGGTGVIDRANTPGWFSKFFHEPVKPVLGVQMMNYMKSLPSAASSSSMKQLAGLAIFLFGLITFSHLSHAERIKDIAMVEGARANQLVGFGLVVGLDGTGDQVTQTPFTIQAARSMLQQFGVNLPPGVNPQTKNMASVIVTAELPAFGKPGQKLM